ncbi:unnamed protein product [Cuscuta campestris]|uniref:Uncharacterized protein n=1 Tax=Cuscuta campestris TaxID=132261 RepID=A0A484KDZ7_9ASTE|nr:unnamed protein product [Cuscuta campestris]
MYSPIMDQCFGAAMERNVSELVIKVLPYKPRAWYSLPAEVFVSDSLKVLELEGCTIGDRIANVDLSHLQKFKIQTCQFAGENVLSRIISGCRLPRDGVSGSGTMRGFGKFSLHSK